MKLASSTSSFASSSNSQKQRAAPSNGDKTNRPLNTQDVRAERFDRPPPVKVPSQDYSVKYGAQVSIAEAQCLITIRALLSVPILEVYGWCHHEGQTFIYMELIQGATYITTELEDIE